MSNDKTNDRQGNGVSPQALLWVAVSLVIVYVIFVAVLFSRAEEVSPDTWIRFTMLLTGVEALVFAATGWLFGREVNRARAEAAEKGKDKADEKAEAAQALVTDAAVERKSAQEQASILKRAVLSLEGASVSESGGPQRRVLKAFEAGEESPSVEERGLADAELRGRLEALIDLAKETKI